MSKSKKGKVAKAISPHRSDNYATRLPALQSLNTDTGYGTLSSTSPSTRSTPELDALATPQQRMFCRAYVLRNFNATEAALAAGYAEKAAHQQAFRLLTQPEIVAAIDSLLKVIATRYTKRTDDVIAELEYLSYSNMMDYVEIDQYGCPRIDLSHLTRAQGAAIKKITSEVIERREDTVDAKTGELVPGYTVRKCTLELHSKEAALQLLGKYHRLWQEGDGRQGDRLNELISALAGPVSDGRVPTPTPAQLQLAGMTGPGTQGQPQ